MCLDGGAGNSPCLTISTSAAPAALASTPRQAAVSAAASTARDSRATPLVDLSVSCMLLIPSLGSPLVSPARRPGKLNRAGGAPPSTDSGRAPFPLPMRFVYRPPGPDAQDGFNVHPRLLAVNPARLDPRRSCELG